MKNPALNIKNRRAVQLAQEVAKLSGESLTEAVTHALEHRLENLKRHSERAVLMSGVARIQGFVAALPELDSRSSEEILGYDEFGLPG